MARTSTAPNETAFSRADAIGDRERPTNLKYPDRKIELAEHFMRPDDFGRQPIEPERRPLHSPPFRPLASRSTFTLPLPPSMPPAAPRVASLSKTRQSGPLKKVPCGWQFERWASMNVPSARAVLV